MMLLKISWRAIRPYWGSVIAVLVLQVGVVAAMLALPTLNARIIDLGVARGDIGYIWRTGGIMLTVSLIEALALIGATWYSARLSMRVGRDLSENVYYRINDFSVADLTRFGVPTLITRTTNDVRNVQMVILLTLSLLVTAPLMIIGGVFMAWNEDPGLSWLVWATIPVLLVIVGLLVSQLVPLFRAVQERIDDVNKTLREHVMGIRVVRAFVREDYERNRFDTFNSQLSRISFRVGVIFVLLGPIISLILNLANVAVLWFGGQRVADGHLEVGSLTAYIQYLTQILTAVVMASFMLMALPQAMVSARRIGAVLTAEPSVHDVAEDARAQTPHTGAVEFRNVCFNYPPPVADTDDDTAENQRDEKHDSRARVLDGISFTVEPGTTTAIVGSTGAGKTALIELIPRLYDPQDGEVLLGGVPVTQLSREQLAEVVAFTPQKAFLFSGTVAENLRLGAPEATDEQLWEALEVAQAAEFVRERGGLDSEITQGATNLSGGQRQRLCIAHTVAADPALYLFDDSFSALDMITDAAVRAGLAEVVARRGATTVLVAQRITTIQDADQILVLDAGRIVARGTHEQLLAESEVYRDIALSQVQDVNPS